MNRFVWIVGCFLLGALSCAEVPRVTVSGPINDLANGEPLEGVLVCWVGQDRCVQTGSDGRYTFTGVPQQSEMLLALDSAGYAAGLVPVLVGSADTEVAPLALGSTLLMDLQSGLIGVDSILGRGQLVFSVSNGIAGDGINVPQIAVAIEPSSGDGPYYTTPAGLPNVDLVETTVHGGGVVVNLEPGRYTLRHRSLPEGCSMILGWGEPRAVVLEVQADRVTYSRIECLWVGS